MRDIDEVQTAIEEWEDTLLNQKRAIDPGYLRNALQLRDLLNIITDGTFFDGMEDDSPETETDIDKFLHVAWERCHDLANDFERLFARWEEHRNYDPERSSEE